MRDSSFVKRFVAALFFIVLAAIGFKSGLLAASVVPFNADEAVVGLMARHILQGGRPIFFYGQAYMGSLDAWLVAGGFWLFGEQVWVIRLVQIVLYTLFIATTAWLGVKIFNEKTGLLAAGLLAIPTVNVTLYTTVSLGGYGEALLIGNLILLVSIHIADKLNSGLRSVHGSLVFWGFLVGVGLWAFGMTLVYALPSGVYLAVMLFSAQRRDGVGAVTPSILQQIVWIALGFLAGSVPWWSYALNNGIEQLIVELGGGAIAGVENLPYLLQIGQHAVNLFLLGSSVIMGLRPPWAVEWLGLPLLPFVFIVWMLVILYTIRQLVRADTRRPERLLLMGVTVTLCIGFVFTPFGADPSGRYFIPMTISQVIFASAMIFDLIERNGKWAWGIAALLIIYHLWGTLQVAFKNPPGITTQFNANTQIDTRDFLKLAKFLHERGETRGYTNYWVGYPLAFLTNEQLVYVARLPYHPDFRYTERDDRYPPYDEAVEKAEQVAYITTRHTQLDIYLRAQFVNHNVHWEEVKIGDFQVFFALTNPVSPFEIGLGRTTP